MTEIIFKRDSSEDYEWKIRVICELNSSQTYVIKYVVKNHLFINQTVNILPDDPQKYTKRDSVVNPLKHLMAGTPVSPICCASFREALVDLFATDPLLK